MSFKNLGNLLNSFGGSFNKIKEFSTLLNSLGGTSLSNVNRISNALNTLKNASELSSTINVIKNISVAMKTFDGSVESVRNIGLMLVGLSDDAKLAALGVFDLSEEQIKNALIASGMAAEEAAVAAATAASGTAATGAAAGFTAFAASVKAAAAGLATFLLTNPVGWAILAVGAIAGVVGIVDAVTTSFEEAKEQAEESRGEYEEVASEVASINSELETTKQRIDELKAKGTLTLTEEEELTKLEQTNEMLERQLAIKQKLANHEKEEAAKDANEVLTKKGYYETGRTVQDYHGNTPVYVAEEKYGDIIDEVAEQQAVLNSKREEYNQLLDAQSKLEPKYIESLEKEIDELDGQIAENLGEISTQYEMLFDEDGKVIEGFEDTVERANKVMDITIESTEEATESVEELSEAEKKASESAALHSATIDTLKTQLADYSTYQTSVNEALEASKSATGLTEEQITNLTNAYKGLDSFDAGKLFEETAHGIHLNADELNRLNEEYASSKIAEYAKEAKQLQKDIYRQRVDGIDTSSLEAELESVRLLQAQYEGLTSEYNKWLTAKSGAKERDSYESIAASYEEMQETLNQGWYGDEALNAYLDLILSASQRTGDAQKDFAKLNETISGTSHSIMDYWRYDDDDNLVTDGLFDFLDDVNKKFGDTYARINEDGQYEFDFDGDKLQEVADAFGMSTEMVELFERALIDAGMAVDMGDLTLPEQIDKATESLKKFKEAGKLSDSLDLDFDVDMDKLEDVKSSIDDLKEERLKIDAETDPELAKELDELIAKCEEQYYFRLNAETDDALDKAIGIIKEMKSLTAAPLTVEARIANADAVHALATDLAALPTEVQTAVGIYETNAGNVDAIISQLNSAPDSIDVPVNYSSGEQVEPVVKETLVNYELGEQALPTAKSALVNYRLGSQANPRNRTVYVDYITRSSGTAHAEGTAISMWNDYRSSVGAYARGNNWALPHREDALVNELGTESIVRDGRWFPIPGGAHVEQLKKGDIIFSAAQTAELIRTGKVISGGGHGKVALADGTAYNTLNLSAYDSGSGGNRRPDSGKSTAKYSSTKSSASKNSSYTKPSTASTSSTKSSDDFEESFDWIEIALTRISEAIDRLKIKAESVYKTLTKRNNAASDEITMIREQIDLQQQAYDEYIRQANSVGLSSGWAEKVRNGSIDISTIKDEALAEKIQKYQEFYDKAVEAKDAIAELHEEIASLYLDKFNNIADDYDNQLSLLEHMTNSYNNGMDELEARGHLGSVKYYEALQNVEKENVAILKDELASLKTSYNEAMASGEIEEGSEAWYEMQQAINETKESIQEAEISLLEYEKTMRELEWSHFDYLQERISSITAETEFMIDLMSSSDLFDDKGNLTDTGMATMGLHGQNYNVHMNQADQYGAEAAEIDKQLAEDPYNTDLIERKEELLELQRESILAANEEKQAIVDLVEEGINIQLDSLKELIDTYTESLDSAKDLYEYQKKVKEQTTNIANLQKQLSAYQGDTSEENRARIQKLQVDLSEAMEDLEETQYDQYITDQKKLLDNLYLEYETILNERLDNVDALLTDVFDAINSNSATIDTTIRTESGNVGYTISESLKSIWSNEGGATSIITKYGEGFTTQLTSVNEAVRAIAIKTGAMVDESNKEAEKTVQETTKTTPTTTTPKTETPKKTTTTPKTTGTQGDGKLQVGDKVTFKSGKYYYSPDGQTPTGSKYQGKQVYITKINTASWATKPYHISTGKKLGSGDLGWLTKSQLSGYATGLKYANKDEDAWVNELGSESIINPTGSAIVTHVAKGSTILDAQATKNIWDMANDPSDFIGSHSFDIPRSTESHSGIVFNSSLGEVQFVLPNIYNYEELINKAIGDARFEKAIHAMTFGRSNGGSALSKYKYVRR